MPRRIIPFVNGEYYHVFNRGVNRQPIFFRRSDYLRLFRVLHYYSFKNIPMRFARFSKLSTKERAEIWKKLGNDEKTIDTICYCFMPNHFHLLLIQVVNDGISRFMANVQNSFARFINTKYKRIGPLWQGQFKAVLLEENSQLLHLSRYIHLNPYSSSIIKIVADLENYEWSSLPEYLGNVKFGICNKNIVSNQFPNISSYRKFVFDRAGYQKELKKIEHLAIDYV